MAAGNVSGEEFRLVFVGKTGVGKSATANTIAQKKGLFKSAPDGQAVTVSCQFEKVEFQGQKILLTDTPGLFDTSRGHDEIKEEIGTFVKLTAPGPHAVLFIMSAANRFTEEEINVIKKMQEMFGTEIENYIIIIITRTENWEEDGMTGQKFLENLPPEAKEILRVPIAAGRCVAFQNRLRDGDPRKTEQVLELLGLVKTTVERNGNKYYSADLWKQAEEEMKRLQEEIKAKEMAEEVKKMEEKEKRIKKEIEEQFAKQMEMLKAEMGREREERERAAREAEKQREKETERKMEEMRLQHRERMEQMRLDAKENAEERRRHEEKVAMRDARELEERQEKRLQAAREERDSREKVAMATILLERERIDERARDRAWEIQKMNESSNKSSNDSCVVS